MVSFTSIITPSLALIGSLAWNEFFKSSIGFISPIDKKASAVFANFIYALIVTIVVLLFYYLYIRFTEKVNGKKHEGDVTKTVIVGIDNKTIKLLQNIVKNADLGLI